jgi:hypothetical protein
VLAQGNDVVSHSRARDDCDEGSCTQSYYFGPSMITVSGIRAMIDRGYFAEGMGCVRGGGDCCRACW